MCGKVGTRFLRWKVLTHVWGWFAVAIGRVVPSACSGDEFRCDIHADDHLLVAGGSFGERSRTFTVALLAIAVLGSPFA